MKSEALNYLRCKECKGELESKETSFEESEIKTGELICLDCERKYPIIDFVPRFTEISNYSDSFAFQRKQHAKIQMDKFNGSNIQRELILNRTQWPENVWKGKTLLECGCGAGPDTQIHLDLGAKVLSADLSTGVDECRENNYPNENLNIIQADIANLPLKKESFDKVYCHRVIQHTPNPEATFKEIIQYLKPGGLLFVHSYKKSLLKMLRWKYLLRPLTTRLPSTTVHRIVSAYAPLVQPMYKVINKSKILRHIAKQIIPYNDKSFAYPQLDRKTQLEYAIHDAFDALTPAHDHPISKSTAIRWMKEAGFENFTVRDKGVILMTGVKPTK